MHKKGLMFNIFTIFLAVSLGFLSVTIPPYLFSDSTQTAYDSSLCPIVRNAVENLLILPTAVMLFIIGFLLGFANPKMWWILSFFTVFIFPAISIVEIFILPTSHNLWPIEFMVYFIVSLPALAGAFIGRLVRHWRRRATGSGPQI